MYSNNLYLCYQWSKRIAVLDQHMLLIHSTQGLARMVLQSTPYWADRGIHVRSTYCVIATHTVYIASHCVIIKEKLMFGRFHKATILLPQTIFPMADYWLNVSCMHTCINNSSIGSFLPKNCTHTTWFTIDFLKSSAA